MPPCIMFSLHVAIAFFCFVFLWGKKINSGETTDVWNPATRVKKPLPTWSEEDKNIQFTLQVCVLWYFQSSVRCIYFFVIIHKGFSPLWMCGLWWIMFTLQFMTDKSLFIFHTTSSTFHDHYLWCLIPMLKCNNMPQTCILCPLPQLFFVFVFLTTSSIAYAQTIFLSVIALHLFSLFIF